MIHTGGKSTKTRNFTAWTLPIWDVWAQTSHIFTPSELDRYKWIRMDQDLENVFSGYFFLDGLLLEFHVKFRAAKFPRYPSLNYLNWPYWPWNLKILTQLIIPAIALYKNGSFYAIFDPGPILHGFHGTRKPLTGRLSHGPSPRWAAWGRCSQWRSHPRPRFTGPGSQKIWVMWKFVDFDSFILTLCIPYKSKTEVFLGFAQIPGVYTQNPRFSKTS